MWAGAGLAVRGRGKSPIRISVTQEHQEMACCSQSSTGCALGLGCAKGGQGVVQSKCEIPKLCFGWFIRVTSAYVRIDLYSELKFGVVTGVLPWGPEVTAIILCLSEGCAVTVVIFSRGAGWC